MIEYVEIQVEIGKLFSVMGHLTAESEYNDFLELKFPVLVETPTSDWVEISALVKKKNKQKIIIAVETGESYHVAEEHIFLEMGKNCLAKDVTSITTKFGEKKVISKINSIESDVYDISIPSPHLFYCSNGAIHHNTQMVEQACASAGFPDDFFDMTIIEKMNFLKTFDKSKSREFYRINFTNEVDESQLVGGFRLVNGNTIFEEGPVVKALRSGGILLLDEIDGAHQNRVLVLQSIMEGKGVLIKETGEFVKPAPGFQVFATSNTKGRGSVDGKYVGLNIMNAAFLDRFCGTIEQDYPDTNLEFSIVDGYAMAYIFENIKQEQFKIEDGRKSKEFIKDLIELAQDTRKNYQMGTTEEMLTTRSLISIAKGYAILGDAILALKLACQRFSEVDRTTFLDYFQKVNGTKDYKLSFHSGVTQSNLSEEFVIKS